MKVTETILFRSQYETRGSEPCHFTCDDGDFLVKYKFLKESQNEYIGAGLAGLLNIPVPNVCIVNVDKELLPTNINFNPKRPDGHCFGSELIVNSKNINNVSFNRKQFSANKNAETILRIAMFDVWTSNNDRSFNNPNMIVEETTGGELKIYAIDHDRIFEGLSYDELGRDEIIVCFSTLGDTILQTDFFERARDFLGTTFDGFINVIANEILDLSHSQINGVLDTLPKFCQLTDDNKCLIVNYLSRRQSLIEEKFRELIIDLDTQ